MTVATDIKALKTRCTVLERRVTALEAKPSYDPSPLDKRIAELEAIVAQLTPFLLVRPATVTLEAGTTVNPNDYADDAVVVGAGMDETTLNGHLDFGSGQEFRDMTIQSLTDIAASNKAGASGTIFRRCRFHGGGTGQDESVVMLGYGRDCDHITFIDCEFDRNLGTEDEDYSLCYNNVSLYATSDGAPSFINFKGCTFGCDNGVTDGSPRMNVECWVQADSTKAYHDITFTGCTFARAEFHSLDLADSDSARASNILISDCVFQGAGRNEATEGYWGHNICIESPGNIVVTGCTFYRCMTYCILVASAWTHGEGNPAFVIDNNTFDMDTNNNIPNTWGGQHFFLTGYDNQFTNNTITARTGDRNAIFQFNNTVDNIITGNTIHRGEIDLSVSYNDNTGLVTTPNTED